MVQTTDQIDIAILATLTKVRKRVKIRVILPLVTLTTTFFLGNDARAQSCQCLASDPLAVTGYGSTINTGGIGNTSSSLAVGNQIASQSAISALDTSTEGTAILAGSNNGYGVYSSGYTGVYGAGSFAGVTGDATNGNGVEGFTRQENESGVYGESDSSSFGIGVAGRCYGSGCTAVLGDGTHGTDSPWAGQFYGNIEVIGGSCTGCGSGSSDVRLKKNIKPITGALEQLLKLRGVTFEWKEPEKQGNEVGIQTGFIAQEVEKVFPSWVHEGADGFKVLNYRQTEGLEVESIRELKLQNDELRDRVKALEAGRRPVISGFGEGGIGLGLAAIAGAILFASRRKRTEARS